VDNLLSFAGITVSPTGVITTPSTGRFVVLPGVDPQYFELFEGTAGGTNKLRIEVAAAIDADAVCTLNQDGTFSGNCGDSWRSTHMFYARRATNAVWDNYGGGAFTACMRLVPEVDGPSNCGTTGSVPLQDGTSHFYGAGTTAYLIGGGCAIGSREVGGTSFDGMSATIELYRTTPDSQIQTLISSVTLTGASDWTTITEWSGMPITLNATDGEGGLLAYFQNLDDPTVPPAEDPSFYCIATVEVR
jgi:hypothetical protein